MTLEAHPVAAIAAAGVAEARIGADAGRPLGEGVPGLCTPAAGPLTAGDPTVKVATVSAATDVFGWRSAESGQFGATVAEAATQLSLIGVVSVEAAVQVAAGMHVAESQTLDMSGASSCSDVEIFDTVTIISSIGLPEASSGTPSDMQIQTSALRGIYSDFLKAIGPLQPKHDVPKLLTYDTPQLLTYPQPLLLTYPLSNDTVASHSLPHQSTRVGLADTAAQSRSAEFTRSASGRVDVPTASSADSAMKQKMSFRAHADALWQEISFARDLCHQHIEPIAFFQSRPYPAMNGVGLAHSVILCSCYMVLHMQHALAR